MANHPAAPLQLRQGDREKLLRLVRSTSVRAGLAQGVWIALLVAEGISNTEIAGKVGANHNTVISWRAGYAATSIEGVADHNRSGRPRRIDHRVEVASVKDLNARTRTFVTGWNDRCHPFAWTRPSTVILKKANRSTTPKTDH